MFGHLRDVKFRLKSFLERNILPTNHLAMFSWTPPQWLKHWRRIVMNLLGLISMICKLVLYYTATSLRHNLRDRILSKFMVPSTATTMQTPMAAMAVQSAMNLIEYSKN